MTEVNKRSWFPAIDNNQTVNDLNVNRSTIPYNLVWVQFSDPTLARVALASDLIIDSEDNFESVTIERVGWLVDKTDDSIVIAGTSQSGGSNTDKLAIPVEWIDKYCIIPSFLIILDEGEFPVDEVDITPKTSDFLNS